jgi:hypothetical protein
MLENLSDAAAQQDPLSAVLIAVFTALSTVLAGWLRSRRRRR